MPEAVRIPHRHLWSLDALTAPECLRLIETAQALALAPRAGRRPLQGRHVALLSETPCEERCAAFNAAVAGLGARLSQVRPEGATGTAPLFGRLYDALDCELMDEQVVQRLDAQAGVPVYRDLADPAHGTRMLALLLALLERCAKPPAALCLAYVGDPTTRAVAHLVRAAVLAGAELRVAAPRSRWPDASRIKALDAAAAGTPGRFFLMRSADEATAGADAVLVARDLAPAAIPAQHRNRALQAMLLHTMA